MKGIVPPLITPLSARDTLDVEGLHRLLDHVIRGGVSGVFILGTTGEAPSLSYRLRREMIDQTTRIVAGRVPVLVGVTDTAFVESVELSQHAADCGADAAVLTTPYYFPAGQTELTVYIQNIAPLIPLPLMLYNMPGLTKVWFDIETLRTLSAIDSIVGVKDSSGDLKYFSELCKLKTERPDWSVLLGPEALLAEAHALGGDGGVSGGANVAPQLFVDCYQRLVDGDETAVRAARERIDAFQAIYDVGKYASRHIKATKSALSILGICSDLPADPFHRFLQPQREQVARILRRIGIL
ncbi:putative 2-keto-3-deoxy-galactonate aldolase YagE [Crateriforma conspicua]|uniref:Putative 2-keto-3-deoxy-galactonate aldolase YagE n=1 Tax=Crateriforma conspicua TaxID=2527996 RepID=A0A5C6FJU3_9PLAN|nr:dihydrodipicolinate synthase family protein [Crateriforma conspicua]TWU62545.1 putative 2-keto-3-deoxy-galactonate aldolase YagE [Crateriforma conspicua]